MLAPRPHRGCDNILVTGPSIRVRREGVVVAVLRGVELRCSIAPASPVDQAAARPALVCIDDYSPPCRRRAV